MKRGSVAWKKALARWNTYQKKHGYTPELIRAAKRYDFRHQDWSSSVNLRRSLRRRGVRVHTVRSR